MRLRIGLGILFLAASLWAFWGAVFVNPLWFIPVFPLWLLAGVVAWGGEES